MHPKQKLLQMTCLRMTVSKYFIYLHLYSQLDMTAFTFDRGSLRGSHSSCQGTGLQATFIHHCSAYDRTAEDGPREEEATVVWEEKQGIYETYYCV